MARETLKAVISGRVTLLWSAGEVLKADRNTLLEMQDLMGMGSTWGAWEVPEERMPDGELKNPGRRIAYLKDYLPSSVEIDSPEAINAWCEIQRFAISRSIAPTYRGLPARPSTVATDLKNLRTVVRLILSRPANAGSFWGRIHEDEVLQSYRENAPARQSLLSAVKRSHSMGYLPDTLQPRPRVIGDEPERDRQGEEVQEVEVDQSRQWQPLPDEFVSEMGWRSLRLINVIAPTLLKALAAAVEVETTQDHAGNRYSDFTTNQYTIRDRNKIIAEWNWTTDDGVPIGDLGFEIDTRNSVFGGNRGTLSWPPRRIGDAVIFAMRLVQPAHLWAVLIGNGNRNSEVTSMRVDCLFEAPDGQYRWRGRTYKLTDAIGGEEIQVEAPALVAQAIVQQTLLAKIVHQYYGRTDNSLWPAVKASEARKLTEVLNRYTDTLRLRPLLGEEFPSCAEHRFRKTLARLVALSFENAPQILRDVFGHSDPEMTLRRYILSDPTIMNEVIEIQKELVILRAASVIYKIDSLGGRGAPGLRERATDFLRRLGKKAFEPQDAYEFARRETFDGRSWVVIAPHIICTAPPEMDKGGPCNAAQHGPNPAYCRSDCDRQVREADGAEQADAAITFIVGNLQRAVDDGEELVIAQWTGQLKTWLGRNEGVRSKWKRHALVEAYATS